MTARICLVTGASSGIGHATALELLAAGHTVYGAARRVERMQPVSAAGGHVLPMDLTDDADLQRVVDTILQERQRIDVLVNNAGVGLYGAAEDVPIQQARDQMEVNLFGPARLTQLVLPHMRRQHAGTIVNVSSIGGATAFPLGAWYHASKHALEAYSDALRREVGRFGIHVVVIQPGIVNTEFQNDTPQALRALSGQGAYRDATEAMARRTETAFGGNSRASDPAVVATAIRRVVDAPAPRPRVAVGYLARPILLLNRLLPDRAIDRVVSLRNR